MLNRSIRKWDLVLMMINAIIGAGIDLIVWCQHQLIRKKYFISVNVLLLLFLQLTAFSQTQRSVFPDTSWVNANPQEPGWSLAKLEQAKLFFDTLPSASLMVIDHGKVVVEWGDPQKRIKISSMRKSLLSALYGIHVNSGDINLDKTLAKLGIDDEPPLTAEEKKATLRMLLKSRSGIYHSYVAGTPAMREGMPARGSHPPGTFWYYNNWDFNALGTVFENQTHKKIAEEFINQIAIPIQMQDFRLEDMYYLRSTQDAPAYAKSVHPAYHFRMSVRDMARFGYLYLHKGNWNGVQIVPMNWVAESTQSYSDTENGEGYGYLWWVNGYDLPVKSFSAVGALGKYLVVIPQRDLVIVYLNHTEFPDDTHDMSEADLKKLPTESRTQMSQLLRMLLDAQQHDPRANH